MKKLTNFIILKLSNSSKVNIQYNVQEIKRDKAIIDKLTGLMYQQGGSSDYMVYEEAKKWIKNLNKKGYAGYHDWRLPTLEEAMSLMEPKKKENDLYIGPVFDKQQVWIWTSDTLKGEPAYAWVVVFKDGSCGGFHDFDDSYVRAVRSGQSSVE